MGTLHQVSARINEGRNLEEILFSEQVLDLSPDIFPPHLVRQFIEKDHKAGVRDNENYNTFFQRFLGGRKKTTLRMVERQLRSAAKADATRRTAMVHQVRFKDNCSRVYFTEPKEDYFVFLEPSAVSTFQKLSTDVQQQLYHCLEEYRESTGFRVPETFFAAASEFQRNGLVVQREIKHKYPFHGLLYGSAVTVPREIGDKLKEAGDLVLKTINKSITSENPNDPSSLFFSIDFFLGEGGDIFISSDVHDQQIGFGIQQKLGVNGEAIISSKEYFWNIASTLRTYYCPRKKEMPEISLNYDLTLYHGNMILQKEIDALSESLSEDGFIVSVNNPAVPGLRLFGGKSGIPSLSASRFIDNREFITKTLSGLKAQLNQMGVKVPRTDYCSVADIYHNPKIISQKIGSSVVFVHPVEHHAFKPFEVDLTSDFIEKNILDIFYKKAGINFNSIPVIVMEKINNGLLYTDGNSYPHEFRCYFSYFNHAGEDLK